MAAFLNRVQTGGPEEHGGIGVFDKTQKALEVNFVFSFVFCMRIRGKALRQKGIFGRVEDRIRGVEDTGSAVGIDFNGQFASQMMFDEIVAAPDNFI